LLLIFFIFIYLLIFYLFKTMIKKILVVLMAVVLTASYAQAQFNYGARAGVTFSGFYGDEAGLQGWTNKLKPGLQLGAVGEYAFGDSWAISPGLLFTQQGMTYVMDDASMKYTLNYIQIPVYGQYKKEFSFADLLIQAGPYFGIGLGGKLKIKGAGEEDGNSKIKFGKEPEDGGDDDVAGYMDKRMEGGLGIGVGLQFGSVQAMLHNTYGLTDMDKDQKAKNNGFVLSVTCLFGK
jgi:hypothetical protein